MARVLFLLAGDFEDSEFQHPWDHLAGAGHDLVLAGVTAGDAVTGKRGDVVATPQVSTSEVRTEHFDALVIPGGYSPDKLRTDASAVNITRRMAGEGQTVAAICHAGSLLIEADVVDRRRVTSWPSIKTDLINAGAEWVDEEVVIDNNLITSRNPGDLDAFSTAIEKALAD